MLIPDCKPTLRRRRIERRLDIRGVAEGTPIAAFPRPCKDEGRMNILPNSLDKIQSYGRCHDDIKQFEHATCIATRISPYRIHNCSYDDSPGLKKAV